MYNKYHTNIKPKIILRPATNLYPNVAEIGVRRVTILEISIEYPKTLLAPITSAKRPPGNSVQIYPQKNAPKIKFT